MKLFLPILMAAIAVCNAAPMKVNKEPKQWAFLVAGSNTWENYRHQADIAHAYQILRRRGLPAENIVVMMYDDVAHDPKNPKPGMLFNKPKGPDVYDGIKIDYNGTDVNAQNFLAVLSGNKKALQSNGTGRVIESGPNDKVFVNIALTGGLGVFTFPRDNLTAKDLIDTLEQMTKQNQYNQLVFYVDADYAGSMFDNLLPRHSKILASASTPFDETSCKNYCEYEDYPCLGGTYNTNWMEHLEKAVPDNENLFDQYQINRFPDVQSDVELYGDFSLGFESIKEFLGPHSIPSSEESTEELKELNKVPIRDGTLHYYSRMAKVAQTEELRTEYAEKATELVKKREFADKVVDTIVAKIAENDNSMVKEITNKGHPFTKESLDCYINVYEHFGKKCFNLNKNHYVLKHLYKFANICHLRADYPEKAIEAISNVCQEDFLNIIGTN